MVYTLAGARQGFADGVGSQALLSWPMSVVLTPSGTLLVADTWNHRLREVQPDGTVTTWAGTGAGGLNDGPGALATLHFPMSLALMPGGGVLLVEPESGMLRTVSAAVGHDVSKLAGAIGAVGWDDGVGSQASISETIAAAVTADGEIVFVDGATARLRALRDGAVDTLAGGLKGGTVDGAGPDAAFVFPRALAVAPDGSVLVVDAAEHALRRVTLPP